MVETRSTARWFVDTNVFVYLRYGTAPMKRARSGAWLKAIHSHGSLIISPQVINEMMRALSRRVQDAAVLSEARTFVRGFLPWCCLPLDVETSDLALDLHERHHLSWWDCVLVASAPQADVDYLLSEDFQDGRRFGRLQIINPFRIAPEDFLAAMA